MRKLTSKPPNPASKADGEQCSLDDVYCCACNRWWNGIAAIHDGREVTGPFTWLQGHPYCEVCYPKMVAVLEADARLVAMRPIAYQHIPPSPTFISEQELEEMQRLTREFYGIPRGLISRPEGASYANIRQGTNHPVFKMAYPNPETVAGVKHVSASGCQLPSMEGPYDVCPGCGSAICTTPGICGWKKAQAECAEMRQVALAKSASDGHPPIRVPPFTGAVEESGAEFFLAHKGGEEPITVHVEDPAKPSFEARADSAPAPPPWTPMRCEDATFCGWRGPLGKAVQSLDNVAICPQCAKPVVKATAEAEDA